MAAMTTLEAAEIVRKVLADCAGDRTRAASVFTKVLGTEIAERQKELATVLRLLQRRRAKSTATRDNSPYRV